MKILDELLKQKDDKYQLFFAKLVPNIPSDKILGVKTPILRDIAKKLNIDKDKDLFLNNLPHQYNEENLIHIFVISMNKDFNKCINDLENFFPYIDCWPVADQSTPKIFKKKHKELLPLIYKWLNSKHIYTIRYAIRMLMNEFLDDDFKDEYLSLVASIRSDDYYLKMMQAWYFATALAKQYDSTIKYFENKKLDEWVHKKAIQKANESYRVSDEHKQYLRTLK